VIIIDLETSQLQASQKIVRTLWENMAVKIEGGFKSACIDPLYCQLGIQGCGFSAL
jgi:hypothetical protein